MPFSDFKKLHRHDLKETKLRVCLHHLALGNLSRFAQTWHLLDFFLAKLRSPEEWHVKEKTSYFVSNWWSTVLETNIFTPEHGWLEYDRFLLGPGLFSGAFVLVLGSVIIQQRKATSCQGPPRPPENAASFLSTMKFHRVFTGRRSQKSSGRCWFFRWSLVSNLDPGSPRSIVHTRNDHDLEYPHNQCSNCKNSYKFVRFTGGFYPIGH